MVASEYILAFGVFEYVVAFGVPVQLLLLYFLAFALPRGPNKMPRAHYGSFSTMPLVYTPHGSIGSVSPEPYALDLDPTLVLCRAWITVSLLLRYLVIEIVVAEPQKRMKFCAPPSFIRVCERRHLG
ncbi:hypothetical protein EJ04DRAFT_517228 [Polyplosphaeria fusca]|uniref:Uncharacterized protein n=1 Tax=Polyplosphaeria fusca TaxID=682080 RepID=A0A9P4UUS2_9PLEO|nr:hypothetical protein EJ04DRAFT_517228 [Polyplosphaeria fusca]